MNTFLFVIGVISCALVGFVAVVAFFTLPKTRPISTAVIIASALGAYLLISARIDDNRARIDRLIEECYASGGTPDRYGRWDNGQVACR